MNECRKKQWPPKKRLPLVSPRAGTTCRPSGKNLFKNHVFLRYFLVISLIFHPRFHFDHFGKFWFFSFFWSRGAGVSDLSVDEFSILLYENLSSHTRKIFLSGFYEKIIIYVSNLSKTSPEHILASNVKFHPKGATSSRSKESASHHYKIYLKIMFFLAIFL